MFHPCVSPSPNKTFHVHVPHKYIPRSEESAELSVQSVCLPDMSRKVHFPMAVFLPALFFLKRSVFLSPPSDHNILTFYPYICSRIPVLYLLPHCHRYRNVLLPLQNGSQSHFSPMPHNHGMLLSLFYCTSTHRLPTFRFPCNHNKSLLPAILIRPLF